MKKREKSKIKLKAVLLNDTSVNNHHGCSLVVENIYKYCQETDIEILHTVKINGRWDVDENINIIKKANVVLINGEGTMHHSKNKAIVLASSAIFCRQNGIFPVMINSVYEKNNDYINKAMAFFKLIFVRESRSQSVLSDLGLKSMIVPDMTFGSNINYAFKLSNSYVLYTDSVDNELTNKLYALHKNTKGSRFITTKRRATKNQGVQTQSWYIKKYIRNILFWIQKRKKRKAKLNAEIEQMYIDSTDDFIKIIANARFIITGRFHILCLALQTRTPFVVLSSNTHKIEGLLNDIGLGNRLITVNQLYSDDLTTFMRFDEDEDKKISEYCEQSKTKIYEMFEEVKTKAINDLFVE